MKNLRLVAITLPLIFACSTAFSASASHCATQETQISFQQALDIVVKAGYKNIHKIELEHHRYEVEAFDANGKEVEFTICPKTGAITMSKAKKHHEKHHPKHHAKHAKKPAEPAAEDKAAQ